MTAGYRTDGAAIYSDIIGDAAEIPNVRPQTVPGSPDYTVNSIAALDSALASATAGQTILVQNGSYGTWYPSKVNGGAKIRVIAQNWWGTSGSYVTFANIYPDGVTGVSFENLNITGSWYCRPDQGYDGGSDYDLLSCKAKYIYHRVGGNVLIQYCIADANYAGRGMQGGQFVGTVTIRNCIICRAGNDNTDHSLNFDDNVQLQGHSALIFENNAVWGNVHWEETAQQDPHPDLCQINGVGTGTGQLTIRRNLFWGGLVHQGTIPGLQGAQGLFLSDGTWPYMGNMIEENLICDTALVRTMSLNHVWGTCQNNTLCGVLALEDKGGSGDNSGLSILNNFCQLINIEGSSGNPAASTGNVQYITGGTHGTYLRNTSGDMRSWRDYIPVDDDYDKYTPYLAELVAIWEGGDPAAPVITGNPTISGTENVGQTLTATPASVSGSPIPDRTWQWYNSASGAIGGATSSTYTLQASDEGDTVYVIQIETNTTDPFTDTAQSANTGTIGAALSSPTISTLSPADNATGVSVSSDFVATFDQDIQFGTGTITLWRAGLPRETWDVTLHVGTGPHTVSISGAVLTINTTQDMFVADYSIRIDPGAIESLSGAAFAGITDDTTWNFSTGQPTMKSVLKSSAMFVLGGDALLIDQ